MSDPITECAAIRSGRFEDVPCQLCGRATSDPYMLVVNLAGVEIEFNFCGMTCLTSYPFEPDAQVIGLAQRKGTV